MKKYLIGIDIGGTSIKLGVFGKSQNLIHKWEIKTRTIQNGKYIIDDIKESIDEVIETLNIKKDEIVGAGVGIPGPIKEDGTVLGCANLGWPEFNVEQSLEQVLQLPVKVCNDANIALLGEMYAGCAVGYKSIIMVTLGTGVGGGVVINEKLVVGKSGVGGEIGHINVNPQEKNKCNCGRRGCLEQYASATGIANLANKIIKEEDTESKLRDLEHITAKDVFDLAKENDELANKVINKFSYILGVALANMSCILDPEVFIIGGGVSKAGDMLIDNIKKYYSENAFNKTLDVEFKLAKLGNDAGIYGGAKLIEEII